MKLKIEFTKKEANMLAKVAKAYDFANHINTEKLSRKYAEGNSAGYFKYSGIEENGATIKFETHEKLILAASSVYLKYSNSVNGVICSIKSLVISVKGLLNNFITDYNKELNSAFAEIEADTKAKKAAKKAAAKADYEARAQHVKDLFKKLDEEKDLEEYK